MHQQTPLSSRGVSPESDDEHQQTRAWAKSSISAAPSVSTPASSSSRSAKSLLAVSVSGPAFHASAMEPVPSTQTRSPRSNNSRSRMALASSESTSSLKREFRGKCLYQSRKCENERALKRNGKAHNLCDEHRSKQNQHQRKFDAKKFSRKRRRGGSSGEGQSGDDDDEGEEEDAGQDDDGDETMSEGRRRPGGRRPGGRRPVQDSEALKPEREPSPPSRATGAGADKPQRKIRRFDGAKHAGRRPRHEMETTSQQQQIKSEVEAMSNMSVRSHTGLVRPQYVPEQYRGDPVNYQHQQSREYPPRPFQPHKYSTMHSGIEQQQYQHQYHPSVAAREREESRYYHPAHETPRGVSGTSPRVHPSPRNASFVGQPLGPLRPLSAIVSTPSSRIPMTSQQEHMAGERAPTPEQVYRQAGEGSRERRHTDGGFEAHADFSERCASYDDGNEASTRLYPPQYQAERTSYPPGRYSTAPEASSVRVSSPHGLGTAYAPQYSQSELMAASILVPGGAAPVVRHPQYTEPSVGSGVGDAGATERGYPPQHQHTSVSPRGMPPMYHPSSYAISPHHARLQGSGSSSASYLRAQQQMQISAERERRETRSSSDLQRRHSPPSAAVSPYTSANTLPPRILPSLATQVSAAISSASTGPTTPFSSKPAPTTRAMPLPARELSGHQHQQYHQHDGHQPSPRHQLQPQSRHHHPAVTPPAVTPVLPSLAPFRSSRDPSKTSREQQHYSTPAPR